MNILPYLAAGAVTSGLAYALTRHMTRGRGEEYVNAGYEPIGQGMAYPAQSMAYPSPLTRLTPAHKPILPSAPPRNYSYDVAFPNVTRESALSNWELEKETRKRAFAQKAPGYK